MQPIRNIRNCALSWVLSCKQPDLWPHAHPSEFPNDLWAYPVSSGVAQEESTETRGSRGRIRMHRMQLDASIKRSLGRCRWLKSNLRCSLAFGVYMHVFMKSCLSRRKQRKFTDIDACCPGHPGRCAGWMPWLESDKSRGGKSNMQMIEINQTQYEHRHILLHWWMRGFPEHETSYDSKYMRGRNVWRALTKLSSFVPITFNEVTSILLDLQTESWLGNSLPELQGGIHHEKNMGVAANESLFLRRAGFFQRLQLAFWN